MPYHDDDADLDDREYPEDDDSDDGLSETITCPSCRKSVYEDAERCPHCGHYLTREDGPSRRPLWFILAALLCLAVALSWIYWG